MSKRVSIICPTFNRESFLAHAYTCFHAQTYENKEFLMLDDSPSPSLPMQHIARLDARFRYIHSPTRLSIGQKRNLLIHLATGEVIVHFDDDDHYGPDYVSFMYKNLAHFELVKLSGWFNFSQRLATFAYWDTAGNNGQNFLMSATRDAERTTWNTDGQHQWVYGFSYVYLKSLAQAFPFLPISSGEDNDFIDRVRKAGRPCHTVADTTGIMLHLIHSTNASHVWPQYTLPLFLLDRLFPGVMKKPDQQVTAA